MKVLLGPLTVLVTAGFAVAAEPAVKGLRPGDEVSAWEPVHVAGPHAGTQTCPVCTYLDAPVLLAFAKDAKAAGQLAPALEGIAAAHAKGKLRVLLVVVDGSADELRSLAKEHSLRQLMLCRPDPRRKEKQLRAYKVDAIAANSVVLYQDYAVKRAWSDLEVADLGELKKATDGYLPKR